MRRIGTSLAIMSMLHLSLLGLQTTITTQFSKESIQDTMNAMTTGRVLTEPQYYIAIQEILPKFTLEVKNSPDNKKALAKMQRCLHNAVRARPMSNVSIYGLTYYLEIQNLHTAINNKLAEQPSIITMVAPAAVKGFPYIIFPLVLYALLQTFYSMKLPA